MSAPGDGSIGGSTNNGSASSDAVLRNSGGWKKKSQQQQQQDGTLQPAAPKQAQGNSQHKGGQSKKLSAGASAFVPGQAFDFDSVPAYRPPNQQPYLAREAQLQQGPASSATQAAPTSLLGPAPQQVQEVDPHRYRAPHQQPYQQLAAQQPQAQAAPQPQRTSKAQRQQQELEFEQARQRVAQFTQRMHDPDQKPAQPYLPQQSAPQPTAAASRAPARAALAGIDKSFQDTVHQQQQYAQQQPRPARGRGAHAQAQRPPPRGTPSPSLEQVHDGPSSFEPPAPGVSGRGRGGKQQRGETRSDGRAGAASTRPQANKAPTPTSSPPPQASSASAPAPAAAGRPSGPNTSTAAWREGHADNSMLAKTITEQLMTNKYDCSICSETIGRRGKIWSCSECHIIIHLSCITKWYESNRAQSLGDPSYRCPGCMFVRTEPPGDYYCFCLKTFEPEHSPFMTPHSCGNNCGKLRNCGVHACELPCHPGFCARCTLPGPMSTCACGSTEHRLKCGEQTLEKPLCNQVCSKSLGCARHKCEQRCHNGPCESCKHTHELTCFCGQRTEERTCGQAGTVATVDGDADAPLSFSCESICNKQLDCGQHSCTQRCHSGPCTPCARQPPQADDDVQACACGKAVHARAAISEMAAHVKIKWSRASCKDPLPSCGAKCAKILGCEFHTCTLQCGHAEPCGMVSTSSSSSSRGPQPPSVGCTEMVKRQCRCAAGNIVEVSCISIRGDSSKGIPAPSSAGASLVRCDVRCRAKLACKKHTCNQLCCPRGDAHVCAKICSKPLACGQHNCDAHCHLGACPPCAVTHRDGLRCACGRTGTRPNVPCGTAVPGCPYPCQRPRECGHACLQTCHENPCAPCVVLGPKMCAGGHTQLKSIPCFSQPSCGVTCKKLLRCGSHQCQRPCHAGKCTVPLGATVERKGWSINPSNAPASSSSSAAVVEEEEDDGSVRSCLQKCSMPRSDCGHPCTSACHPGQPCPTNTPCKENVRVYCACKRLSKVVPCGNGGTTTRKVDSDDEEDEEEEEEEDPRVLLCTQQCELETRNARFRNALQLDETRETIPYPSELLQQIIALDLTEFLLRAERLYAEFLLQTVRTKTFAPMPSGQRWLVHQLAAYHNCDSESFDPEPRRAVRVVKGPSASLPAKMKLSDAVKLFKAKAASGAASAARTTLPQTAVLHLWDLDQEPRIAPVDLALALRSYGVDHSGAPNGNFRVTFLDRSHAMVVFTDASLATNIRAALERRNLFRMEPGEQASKKAQEAFRNGYAGNSLFRRHGDLAKKVAPSTAAASSSAFNDWSESRVRATAAPVAAAAASVSSWDAPRSKPNASGVYTSDQMSEDEFQRFLASTSAKESPREPNKAATPLVPASTSPLLASSPPAPVASASAASPSVSSATSARVLPTGNQWSMLDAADLEAEDEQADSANPPQPTHHDSEDGDWQLLAAQPSIRRNRKASEDESNAVAKAKDAFDD